jgi:hypothetical protein
MTILSSSDLKGVAKPRPFTHSIIAVLTPMTRPDIPMSGPPELPGLMAASVCISHVSSLTDHLVMRASSDRSRAETTHIVTVLGSVERGLPNASTILPAGICSD